MAQGTWTLYPRPFGLAYVLGDTLACTSAHCYRFPPEVTDPSYQCGGGSLVLRGPSQHTGRKSPCYLEGASCSRAASWLPGSRREAGSRYWASVPAPGKLHWGF